MSTRKPKFYLRLTGDDISPENTRIRTLFGVLRALEGAIEAMATELDIEFGEHEAILIPATPEASSLDIPGRFNHKAVEPMRRIDLLFYREETENFSAPVASEFGEMQRALASRGLTASVESEDIGLHGVTITGATPEIAEATPEETEPMTSHTVVYGVCMRVNRKRRDASVQLHDGTNCTVKGLDDDQLQLLLKATGEDLDQVFRLEGQAAWHLDDYGVSEIRPSDIRPVTRDAGKLFDELRELVGDDYEDVDPIEYVRQLRGK